MPVARIVARRFQDALEFAENLRSRFHTIEIAAPNQRPSGVVDLEIRLDNCSPRAALGQVLEYLADHPAAAEKVAGPAKPELDQPAALVLPVAQDLSPSLRISDPATAAQPAADLVAQRSWLRAMSTLFRSSARASSKSSTSLNDVAASAARLRRELQDDRFWIPPAYKSATWIEAERQRRAQNEQRRLAEIAAQRQDSPEVQPRSEQQVPVNAARVEPVSPAPATKAEEPAVRSATSSASDENKNAAPVSPPVPFPGQLPIQTLTPKLRQLEARRWRQAAVMATAAAVLITLSIMGLQGRGSMQSAPTEVERENVPPLATKPAAEDASNKPSEPVLLSSAAERDTERPGARPEGWRKRTAADEVDYIASDVIVRHFETAGERRGDRERRAAAMRSQNRGRVKTISDFEQPASESPDRQSGPLHIKQISDFNLR
jgi:hypothetical protein